MAENKTDKKKDYHVVIKPKSGWFDINLKEVWAYRDLILQTTKRSFKLRYKQTVLGPLWLFISPILTALTYVFVFGNLAGMSTDGTPQMLFYMSGTAIWGFFASCLSGTSSTFTGNAGLFGKVYFPRLTMPISNVLNSLINFCIQFVMFLALWGYYVVQGTVTPNYLAILTLPLILLQLATLGLGLGILISSITTKYRDLSILVGFGISLWMYITPVIYPVSTLGNGGLYTVVCLNPVTSSMELFKYAFLGQGMISPLWWGVTIGITLFVLFAGIVVFSRVEKTFMDTV